MDNCEQRTPAHYLTLGRSKLADTAAHAYLARVRVKPSMSEPDVEVRAHATPTNEFVVRAARPEDEPVIEQMFSECFGIPARASNGAGAGSARREVTAKRLSSRTTAALSGTGRAPPRTCGSSDAGRG